MKEISQSIIKDWKKYLTQEMCGEEFNSKHISKTWLRKWDDSDAKALGRYFEFILTGAPPNGYEEEPKPKYMLTPVKKMMKSIEDNKKDPSKEIIKLTVDDMEKPYREVHRKVNKIKAFLEKSGIVLEACQVQFSATKDGVNLTGNIDIFARYNGQRVVIDVKFSGLIDDRWTVFGWRWTDEQKDSHGIQAKQYHTMTGLPFYWLVVDASPSNDQVRFFKADIDEHSVKGHIKLAKESLEEINFHSTIGFKNYPSFNKCQKCPLNANCKDAMNELEIEVVKIV